MADSVDPSRDTGLPSSSSSDSSCSSSSEGESEDDTAGGDQCKRRCVWVGEGCGGGGGEERGGVCIQC